MKNFPNEPGDFEPKSGREGPLDARSLNDLRSAQVRQLTGAGETSVQRFGNRNVVRTKKDLQRGIPPLQEFVVLEEDSEGDLLKCVLFEFKPGTPEYYDANLDSDAEDAEIVYVAKPYDLQKSPFPDNPPTISPPYKTGDIITARQGTTGYTYDSTDIDNNDTTPLVTWMDINTAGRSSAVLANFCKLNDNSTVQEDVYDAKIQDPVEDELDFNDAEDIWLWAPNGDSLSEDKDFACVANGTFTVNVDGQDEERPLYILISGGGGGGGGTKVCQVPKGGIPAMGSSSDPMNPGLTPGQADCEVWALEGGILVDQHTTVQVNSLLNVVIPDTDNGGSGWVTVTSDDNGNWWVPSQGFLFEYCV